MASTKSSIDNLHQKQMEDRFIVAGILLIIAGVAFCILTVLFFTVMRFYFWSGPGCIIAGVLLIIFRKSFAKQTLKKKKAYKNKKEKDDHFFQNL